MQLGFNIMQLRAGLSHIQRWEEALLSDLLTCIFVCPGTSWRPGGACLVWIEEALKSMDRDLQQRYGPGAAILYRRGAYLDELQAVACATSSGAVYYNRR